MIGTSDFVDGLISGPITLDNYGLKTVPKTLSTSDGPEKIEKFYVNLRTGSTTGPIVASSSLITVIERPVVSIDLYSFSAFTFTNGLATGSYGPTSFASVSSYTSQPWYSTYFSVSNGIQLWTAPATGNYTIRAAGAGSGLASNTYYRGIIIESTIQLTKGQQYKILVGQNGTGYFSSPTFYAFGGGGGTFMATSSNIPVIVAGGGGGPTNQNNLGSSSSDASSGTSGNTGSASGGSNGNGGSAGTYGGGGGGFYTDGQNSTYDITNPYYGSKGRAFVNGGYGGLENIGAIGGFGGGGSGWGSTNQGAGGGGGYSGGGSGATTNSQGGGGGSYSQTTISVIGLNRGNGYLIITKN